MDRQQTARRGMLVALIVLGVLVVDQLIKIWVKTNMTLHEQIEILSWFKIVFIENNGMAYGMEIGSKLVLSLFRVVAISILGYYMVGLVKRQSRWGYLVCLSMILAGAVGNMLDSMFYGLIFNASSEFYTSYFVPFGTGYAPFMMGKVVDMFYFPLIDVFFSPVSNFADASISVGVVILLLFYRKEISELTIKKNVKADEA